MAVSIIELADSREQTVSLYPDQHGVTVKYMVTGTDDDAAVRQLVTSTIFAFYGGLRFNNYVPKPMGAGVWQVDVHYGTRAGGKGGSPGQKSSGGPDGQESSGFLTFNFDTGTRKVKTTSSLAQGTYRSDGKPKIRFDGFPVGVRKDGPRYKAEGIDVEVPAFEFTVTRSFGPEAEMDHSFVDLLATCAWHINRDTIDVNILGIDLHFDPQTLLFKGATGSQKSGGISPKGDIKWEGEVALKFAAQNGDGDKTVAGVQHVMIDGWDYVDVITEDALDSNKLVAKAIQVNTNQIYPLAVLAPLFYGGGT